MNVLSLFDGISAGRVALERAGIKIDNYFASEIDKYAIQVTMKNHPSTIQIGDVRNVDVSKLPKIDILLGGSPCFTGETKIICENEVKPIKDVCVGDSVLTHKNRYEKVLKTGSEMKSIYKVLSQSSTGTETTENHPYYARKRERVWNNEKRCYEFVFSEPEWVKAKDLTKEFYLATPILKTESNPLEITEDEAFLIGVYIGDGHTRKDFRVSEDRPNDRYWQLIISLGSHKKDRFQSAIKINHSMYLHTPSVFRAVFSSKRLVEYVEKNCGIGAENKFFSKEILNLPTHLLEKVIDGYLFTDGSFRKNSYRATTISKTLVESLTLAVAKVYKTTTCIEFTKRPLTTVIEGRTVNQKDTWTISFRKQHPKASRSWVIGDFIWNVVKRVEKTEKVAEVFNLEVENDNSYTANNHIVHNCQGFSFAGRQLNFEDPRSKLFFEYVRTLKEAKPKYFLLENVKMKKEFQDVISEHLGVEPIEINSSLLSAQNRRRLYWTNIPNISMPKDKGILLKHIVHENEHEIDILPKKLGVFNVHPSAKGMNGDVYPVDTDKSRTLTTNKGEGQKISIPLHEYIVPFDKTLKILDKEVERGKVGYFRKDSQANRVYFIHDKAVTLCGDAGGGAAKMGQYLFGQISATSMYQVPRGFNEGGIVEREKAPAITVSKFEHNNYVFGCMAPDRLERGQNGQRFSDGKKFYTLTAQDRHGVLVEGYIRKLTPIECERLQTFDDMYTDGISNAQRYKCLGNSWTVDVIAHILSHIIRY